MVKTPLIYAQIQKQHLIIRTRNWHPTESDAKQKKSRAFWRVGERSRAISVIIVIHAGPCARGNMSWVSELVLRNQMQEISLFSRTLFSRSFQNDADD